jgi:hypothetical protein
VITLHSSEPFTYSGSCHHQPLIFTHWYNIVLLRLFFFIYVFDPTSAQQRTSESFDSHCFSRGFCANLFLLNLPFGSDISDLLLILHKHYDTYYIYLLVYTYIHMHKCNLLFKTLGSFAQQARQVPTSIAHKFRYVLGETWRGCSWLSRLLLRCCVEAKLNKGLANPDLTDFDFGLVSDRLDGRHWKLPCELDLRVRPFRYAQPR